MCLPSPSPGPKYYLKTGNVATKNSERQSVKGTDLGSYDLTNAKRVELTYLIHCLLLPFNQLFCFAFFFLTWLLTCVSQTLNIDGKLLLIASFMTKLYRVIDTHLTSFLDRH